jgi:hypothetical protein|mmetsp:Transcript_29391/g.90952  ORF Transcript_29391/g.90952 Transcript_29391/m.90952 type:complete len:178 (-) Transcript_29391:298-831(-)
MYLFFRLYHLLFRRLEFPHKFWEELNSDGSPRDCTDHVDRQIKTLSSIIHGLVLGPLDARHYEESCRALLGSSSCLLSSIDVLVVQVLKQLQRIINDGPSCKLVDLWHTREKLKHEHQSKDLSMQPLLLSSYEAQSACTLERVDDTVCNPRYVIQYHGRANKNGADAFSMRLMRWCV